MDGRSVAVGGPALLRERGARVPADLAGRGRRLGAAGRGRALRHRGTRHRRRRSSLEDEIRPESTRGGRPTPPAGVRVAMITGDARQVADSVAAELGIDEVFAEVLPEDKHSKVAELQDRGLDGGDGGRRRQRRPRPGPGRRRHRHRRRHRRRHRVGRDRPRLGRPAGSRRHPAPLRRPAIARWCRTWPGPLATTWSRSHSPPVPWPGLEWSWVRLLSAILMSVSTIVVAINAQFLRRLDLTGSQTG